MIYYRSKLILEIGYSIFLASFPFINPDNTFRNPQQRLLLIKQIADQVVDEFYSFSGAVPQIYLYALSVTLSL